MKKRVGLSIAALCVLAVASAGFTSYRSSYSTPYATPVVEALAAGDDGSFDGLLRLAETSPRVFHGEGAVDPRHVHASASWIDAACSGSWTRSAERPKQ